MARGPEALPGGSESIMKNKRMTSLLRVLLPAALGVFLLSPAARGDVGRGLPDTAYVIERVVVEGHQVLSTRQILEALAITRGTAVTRGDARARLELLLTQYREMGYPRVIIRAHWEPAERGGTVLRLAVDERERLPLTSVLLEGCHGLPCDALESLMETRAGAVLRLPVIEGDIDRLLEAYGEQGYPYAQIEPRPLWSSSDGLSLTLTVSEGPRVTLDEIMIEGNEATKDHVIRRECGITPGEAYDQGKVDRVRPRLLRLGFFDEVTTAVVMRDDTGRAALEVRVKERRTNSLYGAVGYVPREPKGYLTGVLDLEFHNIAGTGRSAAVRWRTYQPEAFEWTFAYGEPWVFGTPLEADLSVHQEVRDSTFTRTVVGAGLEYPVGERFWARLAGESEGVVAGSGGAERIRGSRRRSAELGFRLDRRDDPLNPTRGVRIQLGVGYGRKRYDEGEDGSVRSTVYRVQFEEFVPVSRRQVVGLMWSSRVLDSSERDIPEHEQFYVGGAESLRGYGEDAFFGYRVVALGAEYRFLLGRRSRLHVFVDGAWLARRLPAVGGSVDRETWLAGYGFGLRSESRLGMIGVDFGIARGEPVTEGKIHLRLESEF